jgi:hypothetical protein
MATLEMVPLRSKMPTGRMTLRHVSPVINPVAPLDLIAENFLDDDSSRGTRESSTTPKVARADDGAGETTARKGGEAR